MKKILLQLIDFYQKWISPHRFIVSGQEKRQVLFASGVLPSGCKFYPSCSEYAKQALNKYTTQKAIYKSCRRVVRCGPWTDGGIDEP